MSRSSKHALTAFLALALACCTSWGTPAPASRTLLDTRPRIARVTLADGRVIEVSHPSARGDTLVGDTLVPRNLDQMVPYPIAIPFASVRSVSKRQVSAGRTLLLIVAIPVGAFGLLLWGMDTSGTM